MLRKGDVVRLIHEIDSNYLKAGYEGVVMQDMDKEGFVPVEFDIPFEGAVDCEGLVESGNGWFVYVYDLEKIS